MFDEKDFFAGKFWSLLKKRVASRERNDELQVDKALLQMLFIVVLDRELISISPKRFNFKDLIHSKDDHEFDGQWRNIREEIISIMDFPLRIDSFAPIIDRPFFTEAFQAIDSELPRSPVEALKLFDYLFFASAAANLGASSRYLSMVARFSSILAGQISRRVEAFALTGEFLTLPPPARRPSVQNGPPPMFDPLRVGNLNLSFAWSSCMPTRSNSSRRTSTPYGCRVETSF